MGIGISWSAMLAPIVAKIIEKIVDALFKAIDEWIKEGQTGKAIATMAILTDKIGVIEESEDKTKAAIEFAKWASKAVV